MNRRTRTSTIAGSLLPGCVLLASCSSDPKAETNDKDSGAQTTGGGSDGGAHQLDAGTTERPTSASSASDTQPQIAVGISDASVSADLASTTIGNSSTSSAPIASDLDAGGMTSSSLVVDAANTSTPASLVDAAADASPASDAGDLEIDGGYSYISHCTGPGPNAPSNVSGFPPGPNATTDSEPWQGWGVSHGQLDVAGAAHEGAPALHTAAPGDSRTSYFLAPIELLGDLTSFAGLRFALKTEYSGGGYYESGYQYKGDVVLQGANGDTTAYAMISHAPDSDWHYYYVPFQASDDCWSAPEVSLAELLSNVTGLGIRAEYSTGTDNTWLADVSFIPR